MTVKKDGKPLLSTSSDQCVIRDFICADGQVSCVVDSVKAQNIKFYGGKYTKPLDFKAAAGTTQVTLAWD